MVLGIQTVKGLAQDMSCLSSMWFKKIKGNTHKERLESFYGPQAQACESLRTLRPSCAFVFRRNAESGYALFFLMQMTVSEETFCTGGSQCWLPAQLVCADPRA